MRVIENTQDALDLLNSITSGIVYIDLETTGLDPHRHSILLMSLRYNEVTYVINFNRVELEHTIESIRYLLANRYIRKVFHNAVFDLKMLFHYTQEIAQNVYCTMVAEQVLKAGLLVGQFTLNDVAYRRLGKILNKAIRENFLNKDEDTFSDEELLYSADDVDVLEPIYHQQQEEIKAYKLDRVISIESQCLPITAHMEYGGVCVDRAKLEEAIPVARSIHVRMNSDIQHYVIANGLAQEIVFTSDGYSAVNVSSPKQMLEIVQKSGIDVESLNKKELSDWDSKHGKEIFALDNDGDDDFAVGYENPLLRKLAIYKAVNKLLGTYYLGILNAINPITGRIHPGFKQCGAGSTGRYSSSSPNFQNMPNSFRLKALGLQNYDIREMFIAAPGKKFLISDYSAVELVITAALAEDDTMLYQIGQGDIHSYVANELFGDRIESALGEKITSQNRKKGSHKIVRDEFKRVSYGIAYGSTGWNMYRTCANNLAQVGIHITPEDADKWVEDWKHKLFPNTGKLFAANSRNAVTQYYTESAIGRRRFWDRDFIHSNKWHYLAAQREGTNQPIQSTSADITKLGQILLYDSLDLKRGRLAATIHDELLVEVDEDYVDEAMQIVKNAMENAGYMILPQLHKYTYQLITAEPKVSNKYDK